MKSWRKFRGKFHRRRPPLIQRFACPTRTGHPPSRLTLTSRAVARRWRYGYLRLSAARRKRGCECGWSVVWQQRARTKARAKFAVSRSKSCGSDPQKSDGRLVGSVLTSLHQHWCGRLFGTLPVSYADCARLRTRLLISRNSETSARVFRPARVAASISVVNKMVVARSALQARQHLSALPGRSKSSLIRPHMQQEPIRF
jgi:hypothetical protein